jgi:hypothetical protein
MSIDAARWTPDHRQYTFQALFIPTDPYDQIRFVDLGTAVYANARTLIGCRLIEKLTVEAAGAVSVDLLFDEEGALFDGVQPNELATLFVHALKLAQAAGRYPAPHGMSQRDLAEEAAAWRRHVRLWGPVVVVGADERTGDWIPAPDRLVEFATAGLTIADPS